jgi:hypothetical protein
VRFPNQNLVEISCFSHQCQTPHLSQPPQFNYCNSTKREKRAHCVTFLISLSLICLFSLAPCSQILYIQSSLIPSSHRVSYTNTFNNEQSYSFIYFN